MTWKLPWVSRALYEQVIALSQQFLHDKQVAEDRLYAAWKDGSVIPPRASVEAPVAKPVTLLPDKLAAYVGNWESPEIRQELETEARRLHFDLGYDEDRVLELFAARSGNGGPTD